MEAILQAIAAADHRELRGKTVSFYQYDATAALFVNAFRIQQGVVIKQISSTVRQNGVTARVLREGKPLVVKDSLQQGGLSDKRPRWVRSFVAVPVEARGIPCGVLYVNSREPNAFSDEDTAFAISLAKQIGAFGESTLLNRPSEFSMVRVLAATVDAKDAYTQNHSINVAFYTGRIAAQMGLPPHEQRRIYLAALLHDIGKIGIPDQVLQKPGRLTPEEWILIKAHPALGANILANASELEDLVPMVRHHHEHYDGNGYPDGIAGDAIPLGAAIISLADAFDAMTSRRVYRDSRTLDQAMAEIRRCDGTQFHPGVVETFEAVIRLALLANEPWIHNLQRIRLDDFSLERRFNVQEMSAPYNAEPLEFLEQARSLQQLTDLDALLEAMILMVENYVRADAVQIFLQTSETGAFQLAKNQGQIHAQSLVDTVQQTKPIKPGEGLIGWAALCNQVVNVTDARLDPRWPLRDVLDQKLAVLIIPIPGTGRMVGALQILAFGPVQFSAAQSRALQVFTTIAGQAVDRIQAAERPVRT